MKVACKRSAAGYPDAAAARVTSREERQRRQRLGEFLRQVEPAVHDATGAEREQLRRLLGWDDESLHAFVAAEFVVHTSPHASMNAFEPAFAFPWLAARLVSSPPGSAAGVHLRTTVTHNNLGDLRWRPYAWWHRSRGGPVVKTRIFSRSAKLRHDVLFAKDAPSLGASSLTAIDREATELAGHAADYAGFCLLYRSAIERHAGLHGERPPIEVPLSLLNAFTIDEDGVDRWQRVLAEFGMSFRAVDSGGRLVEVSAPNAAASAPGRVLLCPNAINLVQAHLLGVSCMIGAERMAKYVPETAGMVGRFVERLGFRCHPPSFVSFTEAPTASVLEHDPETVARLAEDGLLGSLSVGAADIGSRVAANLDRLVGSRVKEILSSVGRFGARGDTA